MRFMPGEKWANSSPEPKTTRRGSRTGENRKALPGLCSLHLKHLASCFSAKMNASISGIVTVFHRSHWHVK